MSQFGGVLGTFYGDQDTVETERSPGWMMDQIKAAAPLQGLASFEDEDDAADAEAETITGTEVPPHLLEEHTD